MNSYPVYLPTFLSKSTIEWLRFFKILGNMQLDPMVDHISVELDIRWLENVNRHVEIKFDDYYTLNIIGHDERSIDNVERRIGLVSIDCLNNVETIELIFSRFKDKKVDSVYITIYKTMKPSKKIAWKIDKIHECCAIMDSLQYAIN